MNETELRIGNLLKNDGVVVTIDALSIYHIWDDKGLKKYEPIPLTEEWLVKFGFHIVNEIKDASLCDTCRVLTLNIPWKFGLSRSLIFTNCFGQENPDWELDLGDRFSEFDFSKCLRLANINHVHQLQNLHHSLTGEELKIKDNTK